MKTKFLIPLTLWGCAIICLIFYLVLRNVLKEEPLEQELVVVDIKQVYKRLESPNFLKEWETFFGKVNVYSWEKVATGRWTTKSTPEDVADFGESLSVSVFAFEHPLEKAIELQEEAPSEARRLQPSLRQRNLTDRQKLIEYDNWEPFTVLPDGYLQDYYLACGVGDEEECEWWFYNGRYGQYVINITFYGFQAGISLEEFEVIYSEIDIAIARTFEEAGAFE